MSVPRPNVTTDLLQVRHTTRYRYAKPVTFGPQAAMVPAVSRPGLNGKSGLVWYWPRTMIESAKLAGVARTSISTRSGSGTGKL